MITVNIDIQNRLNNGQTGSIGHIYFGLGRFCKVFVKCYDEYTSLKAMRPSYLSKQISRVPIEKCEAEISIKKRFNFGIHQAYSISVNFSRSIYCS